MVRIVAAALAGLLYFVVTQLLAVGYLLLAAWAGWDVPGYHEPAEYHWWSWIVFSLWCAGFALVAWWAAFRLPFRRSRPSRP